MYVWRTNFLLLTQDNSDCRPDSADALVWLTAHLRLGKTDAINRELRRGALLEKEIAAGSVLLIRNQ